MSDVAFPKGMTDELPNLDELLKLSRNTHLLQGFPPDSPRPLNAVALLRALVVPDKTGYSPFDSNPASTVQVLLPLFAAVARRDSNNWSRRLDELVKKWIARRLTVEALGEELDRLDNELDVRLKQRSTTAQDDEPHRDPVVARIQATKDAVGLVRRMTTVYREIVQECSRPKHETAASAEPWILRITPGDQDFNEGNKGKS